MWPTLVPFFKGFSIGAGLIIAIGAQNVLLLTQSLRRQHHHLIAFLCVIIDITLIISGVLGLGLLLQSHPELLVWFRWGGCIFLSFYGLRAFARACGTESLEGKGGRLDSRRAAILMTLAISLLNPHVYLDTVILLGSIGGQLPGSQQPWFTLGAIVASCCWFFGVSFGAQYLAPLFKRPVAWRILDILVGCTMWVIAFTLVANGNVNNS